MKNMENLYQHGGNIYEIKPRYGSGVIDFSANINPLGVPLWMKEVLPGEIDALSHYPDTQAQSLIALLARRWKIKRENLLVGNGSTELIYLIAGALRPKTAVLVSPDFSEYERALKNTGADVRFLKLSKGDFSLRQSDIAPVDIFFISNPHNPTANMILQGRDNIEELAPKTVVIDEAFMDFVSDQEEYTMIRKAARHKKIIVLRSFTKFFSIPGLRIGYLVAHKDTVNKLRRYQMPWSVNSLAQTVARQMLDDAEYARNTLSLVIRQRDFLCRQIASISALRPYPSKANFILVEIKRKGVDSRRLAKLLLRQGILVRDCANFRNLGSSYIRVAVRKRCENTKLIRALRRLLQ